MCCIFILYFYCFMLGTFVIYHSRSCVASSMLLLIVSFSSHDWSICQFKSCNIVCNPAWSKPPPLSPGNWPWSWPASLAYWPRPSLAASHLAGLGCWPRPSVADGCGLLALAVGCLLLANDLLCSIFFDDLLCSICCNDSFCSITEVMGIMLWWFYTYT